MYRKNIVFPFFYAYINNNDNNDTNIKMINRILIFKNCI